MDSLLRRLSSFVDPTALMERIAEHVCVYVPKAHGATLTLCTSGEALLIVSAHGATAPLLGRRIEAAQSFHLRMLRADQPAIVDDLDCDTRVSDFTRELMGPLGVRSWLMIPLRQRGKAVGALTVVSRESGVFGQSDVSTMAAMGTMISALIESHRELSALLDTLMSGRDGQNRSDAAEFLASILIPDRREPYGFHDRLDHLLAEPGSIDVVFQPIVDIQTGRVVSVEGLTRFPPAFGLTTAEWFSFARAVGRGPSLELYAFEAVIDAARALTPSLPVGVNLSPRVAGHPAVQKLVLAARRQLVLEITEHEPFPDDLTDRMAAVRAAGVALAVDDAGAGFSSFTQLIRIAPDIIKIDGQLTSGIENSPARRALVRAVVALAEEIGATTVAEAVEERQQADILGHLGVDRAQGYLFARPASASTISSQLSL